MIPGMGIQEPTNWPTPSLKWYTLTRPQVVHFARPLTPWHIFIAENVSELSKSRLFSAFRQAMDARGCETDRLHELYDRFGRYLTWASGAAGEESRISPGIWYTKIYRAVIRCRGCC